ncbi:MAG: Wzy polymerase domain-containing protein, partial [Burkholderiales bacterium]
AALILGATITLILFEYLYPLLQTLIHHNEVSSGLQRLISTGGNGGEAGRRLVEWQKAWMVFKAHPLIGQGFNQFAQQSVYLQPLFPHAPMNDGLFTNCHNLLLQLLAETGLIGTVIVAGGISYVITAMLKTITIETIIILCLFATTLAHSMLEYPLWYIYFLGPFIMFLAIDNPLTKLNSNTLAGIATLPMAGLVYLMLSSSFVFNTLVNYIDTPINLSAFQTQAKYLEDLTQRNSLWAYPALYTLDNYIIIDSSNTNKTFSLNDQLDYENKFTNFHPYPDNLIKQALLKWKLGQHVQAKKLVELALVAFPAYQSSYLSQLKSKQYKPLYELTKRYHYN